MRNRILILSLLFSTTSFSQKKIITDSAYAEWKTIPSYSLSSDGKKFAYTTNPYEGNNTTYLLSLENNKIDSILQISNGKQPKFNEKTTFFTSIIEPDYFKVRKLKIKKTKAEKMPKDTLLVYDFSNKKSFYIPNVDSYKILDSSDVIVGQLSHDFKLGKNGTMSKSINKQLAKGYGTNQKTFFIYQPQKGFLYQNQKITQYYIDEEQEYAVLLTKGVQKKKTYFEIEKLNLKTLKSSRLKHRFSDVETVYASTKENTVFIVGKQFDIKKKQKANDVYRIYESFDGIDSLSISSLIDSTFIISKNTDFTYVKDADKWLIATQRFEPEKEKETLLPEEKVSLDIWSWKDAKIQPEQLKDAKKYYSEKLMTLMDWSSKTVQILEDDTLTIGKPTKKSMYTLAKSSIQYDSVRTYDYPWYADYYRVNLRTGEKELILPKISRQPLLTPDGNAVYYQNDRDTNVYFKNLQTQKEQCVTCAIEERWTDDLNGMDFIPGMEGAMVLDENKTDLWFRSTKALYRYSAEKDVLERITPDDWLNENIELNFQKITPDSTYFNADNILVRYFDKNTKCNHYFTLDENDELTEILNGYFDAFSFVKDTTNHRFLARIQTNELYPNFNIIENGMYHPITNANPQQEEYNWSTVEPVQWTAYDGQVLDGLLYKPEDYDSTKNYPLIVYYYETSSENIHRYTSPRPTASIIFSTEYASSGYFVFIPDIRYSIGYPAKGAYNSIMSGTDYLLKKYPQIDSTRMGLQGQSWGGYQTAQMITMTNRYAAAMAGAPVVNMFSAYGGIRWGSGLNRQFQYEHTQSRIGKTIWEAPELYVENSPLFHFPNVETPVLVMHNDEDGAVPWYQGIEMYMGLRRLNKPVWLLNYNGDDHNLMKKGNRKDLSKRMKQFFDFYLNNGDEPDWMKEGVPAYKKKTK